MSEVDTKQVNGDVTPAEQPAKEVTAKEVTPKEVPAKEVTPKEVTAKEVPEIIPAKEDSEEANKDVNENVDNRSGQDSKSKPDKKFLQKPGVRLGPLLEKDIIPTQEEVKTYQDALAQLKAVLDGQTAIKVARVFEYGSMESGTSVRNHWSVKLIILTEGNVNAQVDAVKGVLKQKLGESYKEMSTSADRVKFTWQVEETSFFGDIRLTTQPEANLTEILTDKYSEEGAGTFKRHLLTTEIQRLNFIKERPEAVKKLIRLLTYLYINEVIEKPEGDSSEVSQGASPDLDVLELVCIWAWGVAGSPETFNLKKGLTKVLDLIARPKDIIIYWTTNYDPNTFLSHIECKMPFIMEAWNPYQNAAADFDWASASKMAETALNSRLMRSTPLEFDWQ